MKYINTLMICILFIIVLNNNARNVKTFNQCDVKFSDLENEITRLDVNDNGIIILVSDMENRILEKLNSDVVYFDDIGDSNYLGEFEATAYTDNVESQEQWVGQTATGRDPQVGVIAVDPKVIPLDTKLYVERYGYCVAGDVGGAIKGDRLDLFMDTREECYEWGRQPVRVWRVD